MPVDSSCPETAYLSKDNIVHPGSTTQVAAAEGRARVEIAQRLGLTISGGAIVKGK